MRHLTTRSSGPWFIVGRVWPRQGHRGRPLKSIVRRHCRNRAHVKYLAAAAAYLAALWAVVMAAIFALISVVGPHSTPWPKPMQTVVYVVAGLAVLVLPALAARAALRSVSHSTASRTSK